ncbi:MAG: diguanylate cyclase (GGDEF)-like protein [Pseudomonadales bacterium]|jgi:diguanylate cyclase (GGDEF)-like protein
MDSYKVKISTAVNKFIANNETFDSRELMRHQFFIYLSLIIIIISLVLITLIGVFESDIFLALQLVIIIFCFSTAGLWVYKKSSDLNNCNNILLTGLFLAGLGVSLIFLNTYGIPTYFYLGIPILAYFIAGSKSGASWTTITLAVALFLLLFKQTIIDIDLGLDGISSQHADIVERSIYLGSMLVVGTCCYLYTYLYYRERKILLKQQAKLLHTINYDDLTGIYNYKKISELAGGIIDGDTYRNQSFAYSFISMDNFKILNDQYGYQFGDKILKVLAHRLNKTLTANHTLARLNGTSFALLTLDPDSHEQTQQRAETLVTRAWKNIKIDGTYVEIITSIGTAIYPIDGSNLKELTTSADRRMLKQV